MFIKEQKLALETLNDDKLPMLSRNDDLDKFGKPSELRPKDVVDTNASLDLSFESKYGVQPIKSRGNSITSPSVTFDKLSQLPSFSTKLCVIAARSFDSSFDIGVSFGGRVTFIWLPRREIHVQQLYCSTRKERVLAGNTGSKASSKSWSVFFVLEKRKPS